MMSFYYAVCHSVMRKLTKSDYVKIAPAMQHMCSPRSVIICSEA